METQGLVKPTQNAKSQEHLTHGYLEITKVATAPTPDVASVVASCKRGAPTPDVPDVALDVVSDVGSTRKRAKTVLEVPAAEVFHTRTMYQHATRVSEYCVLVERAGEMNEKVNKMMKEGWQPLGGPSSEKFFIVQAMVKLE